MEHYSYYIPPNYPDHLWPTVNNRVMFDIEVLKMNLELEQYVRNNEPQEILNASECVACYQQCVLLFAF